MQPFAQLQELNYTMQAAVVQLHGKESQVAVR